MNYLTSRDVYNIKMGRVVPDAEVIELTPKRYRASALSRFDDGMLWVICDICNLPFCVNNAFEDRKPRTPRYKDFIVCVECDPRHLEDRYKKEGYRVIHKRRLRIIQMAQITRQLTKQECRNPDKLKCNCTSCVARKLFPPF